MPCTSAVRAAGSTDDHAVEPGDVEARACAASPRPEQVGGALGQPDGRAGRDRGVRRPQPRRPLRVLLRPTSRWTTHGQVTRRVHAPVGRSVLDPGRSRGVETVARRSSRRCTTTPAPARSREHGQVGRRRPRRRRPARRRPRGPRDPDGDRHRDADLERGQPQRRAGRPSRRRTCARRGRARPRPRPRRCGRGWRGPG